MEDSGNFEGDATAAFPSMEGPDDPTFGGASSDAFFGGEAPASGEVPPMDAGGDPFGAPAANDAPAMMPLSDDFGSGGFAEPAAAPLGDDFSEPAAAPLGDDFGSGAFSEPAAAVMAPPEPEVENPKVTEMRETMRLRLKAVDEKESEGKKKNVDDATDYLETLYKNRDDATERRKKNNREEESLSGGQEARGGSYWERIIEYIDFNEAGSNKGLDMTRYKNVLFAAKAKNVPVAV